MLPDSLLSGLQTAGILQDQIIAHEGDWPLVFVPVSLPPGKLERASFGYFDLFIPNRVVTFSELSGQLNRGKYRYSSGMVGFSTVDTYWEIQYEGRLEGVSIFIDPKLTKRAHEVLGFPDQWHDLTWRRALCDDAPALAHLGLHICHQLRLGKSSLKNITDQQALTLLGLLITQYSSSPSRDSRLANVRSQSVLSAIQYIQQNLQTDLSINTITEIAAASPPHLNRLFRAEIGMSVWQYVKMCRLEAMLRDIKAACGTFSEIAGRYGYQSTSTAAQQLRKQFGHPPSFFKPSRDEEK